MRQNRVAVVQGRTKAKLFEKQLASQFFIRLFELKGSST